MRSSLLRSGRDVPVSRRRSRRKHGAVSPTGLTDSRGRQRSTVTDRRQSASRWRPAQRHGRRSWFGRLTSSPSPLFATVNGVLPLGKTTGGGSERHCPTHRITWREERNRRNARASARQRVCEPVPFTGFVCARRVRVEEYQAGLLQAGLPTGVERGGDRGDRTSSEEPAVGEPRGDASGLERREQRGLSPIRTPEDGRVRFARKRGTSEPRSARRTCDESPPSPI